ncbi:MAG: hypothetical protein ACI4WR_04730, partial [Bulleidia sp.]
LCCTFAYRDYRIGPKKKVGVFLTCTGSEPEEMKHEVSLVLDLPSVSRWASAYQTEVFTHCRDDSCRTEESYQKRAEAMADWFLGPEAGKETGEHR